MSSTTPSLCSHRSLDSATTESTASWNDRRPWCISLIMKLTTSWSSMNSHTPSEATRRKARSGVRRKCWISGSAMTPTLAATWSPKERDMAMPGVSSSRSQMRKMWSSSDASQGATRPPLAMIRAFSSGRSGLWSLVKARAWNCVEPLGSATLYAAMHRESPTLAVMISLGVSSTAQQVEPERVASMCRWTSSCAFTSRKQLFTALSRALPVLPRMRVWSARGSAFTTNSEHSSP
mmetsp:Transcript_26099/g.76539  ORF Transcript_26099/g.76539 Transcript_26099/m.76539 type:complete len:235 (-) Transcript_26099:551-1255(-)